MKINEGENLAFDPNLKKEEQKKESAKPIDYQVYIQRELEKKIIDKYSIKDDFYHTKIINDILFNNQLI